MASSPDLSSFSISSKSPMFYLWHSRLHYMSKSRLQYSVSTGVLGSIKSHDISDCSGCKISNQISFSFNTTLQLYIHLLI